jgi:hypothetical protein
MTDRELLLALVRRKPGCNVNFLMEQFNEVRMVDRPRMKSIIDCAKESGAIKSGPKVLGLNQSGGNCMLATYWLSEHKFPAPVAPIKSRPSLADVILPRDRRPGAPELPDVNRYGYQRGTLPTLEQFALMHIDAINQPMEQSA